VANKNAIGVWGLVTGILGIVPCCTLFVFSIAAIVLGVLGRKAFQRGEATNGGMATAALILGIVGVVLGVIVWIANAANILSGFQDGYNGSYQY